MLHVKVSPEAVRIGSPRGSEPTIFFIDASSVPATRAPGGMCGGPPKMAPTKAAIDAMSQTELFAEFAAANLDMEDLVWLPALKSRLRAHYYGDNGPPTPPTPDSPASLRAASPTPPQQARPL